MKENWQATLEENWRNVLKMKGGYLKQFIDNASENTTTRSRKD